MLVFWLGVTSAFKDLQFLVPFRSVGIKYKVGEMKLTDKYKNKVRIGLCALNNFVGLSSSIVLYVVRTVRL